APGVDDAGTPELTPDARRNYFDHRDRIATADKMIRGMQDYIKEQCLK
ncbi:lysis protein, partial [Citrobacter amalonaticus]